MTIEANIPATEADYVAAADAVRGWRRPLLLTHERPDGDALGSLLALQAMLRDAGLAPTAALFEPCPERYRFMLEGEDFVVLRGADDPVLTGADGVIIVDTCAFGQLTPVADWLKQTEIAKVAVDHHRTRDALADRYLLDDQASAAALLVYRWAQAAGWGISTTAQRAIFVGLATDTGWFRFNNTTPECLRVTADLLAAGVDLDGVYRALFMQDSLARLRGRSAALSTLELHAGGRIAVLGVTGDLLAEAGATPADLEETVNAPMSAADVEVSVILVEMGEGVTKCSFRSKGAVDVSAVAAGLGGGGHERAAGARVAGALDTVKAQVLDRLAQAGLEG